MLKKVLCLLMFLSTLVRNGYTFWWQPSTTKSPETEMKQIPLTYFRTYTYQPLAPNPFQYPFFGGGPGGYAMPPFVPPAPLLNGPRYETHGASHAPFSHPLTAPQPEPTTTPTTTTSTTTTTTTTPPPPPPPPTTTTTSTTSTTTTTTTTPTPPKVSDNGNGNSADAAALPPYDNEYPTYNRRFYSSPPNQLKVHRPSYPYPEYSAFHPAALKLDSMNSGHRSSPQIQFVPCMCPISVSMTAADVGSRNGNHDPYLAETRSANDNDTDMELPQDQEAAKVTALKEKEVEALTEPLEKSGGLDSSPSEEVQSTNKLDFKAAEKPTDSHMTPSEVV